jgi:putative tricarboxylic transport membrane protein
MLEQILNGFSNMLGFQSILWMIFGVTWGTIGSSMPGISSSVAMALLLPLTWSMEVSTALATLAGVWAGSAYGGSIPAILINTPGSPGAAATVLDGYVLHQQGKTGKALGVSLICGTIGGLVSVFTILLVVPLSIITLAFGPAEYFGVAIFGLTILSSLSGDNMLKGLISGLFGLLLAAAGSDVFSATIRFSMGRPEMVEGFNLIPVMIGLFAVAEMLRQASYSTKWRERTAKAFSTAMPTLKELVGVIRATIIGTIAGIIVGIMPGAGQTVSAYVAYSEAKRWSKHPEMFGKGSLEGVAAPETANNAVQGGDMVPALALGIPGSNSAAVMMAALMLHGLTPGPMLFEKNAQIVFDLFAGMIMVNFLMLPVGYCVVRMYMRVIAVSPPVLVASVLTLVTVGTFSARSSVFDVGVAFLFGIIGFVFNYLGFSAPSVVLGLVLGRILETAFRRALILSDGSWMVFIERPISAIFIVLSILILFYPIIASWWKKRKLAASD